MSDHAPCGAWRTQRAADGTYAAACDSNGDAGKLGELFGLLDESEFWVDIVTPRVRPKATSTRRLAQQDVTCR